MGGKQITMIPSTINPLTHQPTSVTNKRRVAAYARVSTLQEEQTSSYEAQIDYYTKYINNNPEWEFVKVYTDEGISATNTRKRDGFKDMISDALNGKIDLIVTKSVSRFARNTVDTLVTVRELKKKGVEVYFEEQNIYTFDSKGELTLTIISSIAQEESRNISENVKWGKRKKCADGYTYVGYKNFLGYDKHPTDAKKGFIINKEEAEIVRKIYRLFLDGKTVNAIADILEEEKIPTPMKKGRWRTSTIYSILTNEKYKGDALIQKTYVKDFLEHRCIKNNGEVDQFYVENHHDAIIEPEDWERVQIEIEKRKKLKRTYSSASPFSSKLICGDCGCFYGIKVWHSTDKYRKIIYRCNSKFDKSHEQCETPTLVEEIIKTAFVKAYNAFIGCKEQVIIDCKEIIEMLTDTTELKKEIKEVESQINVIVELVNKLIEENSQVVMSQVEFIDKYNSYDKIHKELTEKFENKTAELKGIETKKKQLESFVSCLETQEGLITEWDENLMNYFVENMTVKRNNTIDFNFKSGKVIKIPLN